MRSLKVLIASDDVAYVEWLTQALAETSHVILTDVRGGVREADVVVVDPALAPEGLAARPALALAPVGVIVSTPFDLEAAFALADAVGLTVLPCATIGDVAWQLEALVVRARRDEVGPVSAALAALRAGYAAELPRRLGELRARAVHPGRWAEVVEQAHRLAGTAGTFGFPQIGAAARLLEHAADLVGLGAGDVERALVLLEAAHAAEVTAAVPDARALAHALVAEALSRGT